MRWYAIRFKRNTGFRAYSWTVSEKLHMSKECEYKKTFKTYAQAYEWLLENKLHGNAAMAMLAIG